MKTINIFIYFGLVFLWACENHMKLDNNKILNSLPDTLMAGQNILLPPMNHNSMLIVHNSYQTLAFKEHLTDSLALTITGNYTFKIINQGKLIESKKVKVLSEKAKALMLLVGAKSMIANGKDKSMAIVFIEDIYQNVCKQKVSLFALRPQQNTEETMLNPYHLLCYHELKSQNLAGKTLVSVAIGSLSTTAKEITEVAGEPLDFSIKASKIIPYADGNQYFNLKTDVLIDKFGNVIENGTLVELSLQNSKGNSKFSAYTLNGVASWAVRNPSAVGFSMIIAKVGKSKSNALKIQFFNKDLSKVSLERP